MRSKMELFIWSPVAVAIAAACYRSMWLVLATVMLMFLVVAVSPFTRKREVLWLFLLCAVSSIPINGFLLSAHYPQWRVLCMFKGNIHWINMLTGLELLLICTCVEEVLITFAGRCIWRKQYRLMLPEWEEE